MSRETLEREIPPGAILVVDSSAVLAYLDATESTSAPAAIVFDGFVRPRRNTALVSAVTVTETLVRPFGVGNPGAVATVEAFLRHFPNMGIVPLDYDVALEAARVRAITRLRTSDALIVATGIVAGASTAIGNDAGWRPALESLGKPMTMCLLSEHT